MEFNFTGSSRPQRNINLGGAGGKSAAQLAAEARAMRADRHLQKQRNVAATRIQAAFRAYGDAARTRAAYLADLDGVQWPCVSKEDWVRRTRLLVFSYAPAFSNEHARHVAQWAAHLPEDAWNIGGGAWHTLLALVVRQMLHMLEHHPKSLGELAGAHLGAMAKLVPAQESYTDAQARLVRSMLRYGLHSALASYMESLPVQRTPDAGLCMELMLRPFTVFSTRSDAFVEDVADSDAPGRAVALRGFVASVLTLPHLSARLPLGHVQTLAASLPLDEIEAHTQTLGSYYDLATHDEALSENPIHSPYLLGNVLLLASKRVPRMDGPQLQSYLVTLALLQNALPPSTFAAPMAEHDAVQASVGSLMDGDNEPQGEAQSYPTLDEASYHNLRILVSDSHLHAILAQSTKHASRTRGPLCAFLVATLHAWPSAECEGVLTTVLYGYDHSIGRSAHAAHLPTVGAIVRELWRGYVRGSKLARQLGASDASARLFDTRKALVDESLRDEWPVLVVLCQLYGRCLLTMGDDEFYPPDRLASGGKNPLSLDELVTLSGMLRNLAFVLYWHEELVGDGSGSAVVPGTSMPLLALRELATRLLQQLHTRDARHAFTPEGHWHMLSQQDLASFIQSVVLEERDLAAPRDEMDVDDAPRAARLRHSVFSARTLAFISPRLGVLNNIPFVIPFEVRVEIFRQFVRNDAERLHISRDLFSRTSRHRATVRRESIATDGMAQLNSLGPRLKEPVEIVFIDQFGQPEAGIDGGGVFKEFLTTLTRQVFDTDRGLWRTNERQELYPNPHSYARQADQLEWYTFLGRILGKALYDGILVDVKLASFFLGKWLGHQGYLDDLASLHSLDAALYRGLIQLKNYTGDVENDFALNFTVSDEEFGVTHTTELIPGGADIPVTKENRLSYIYHVSRYRLSRQIEPQCRAFFQGLSELIDPRWLRLLSRDELGVLVSGTDSPIDLADLRAHTVYGGFHEKDLAVTYFWEALESMDQASRKAFLRFVTSSPNPPLLGFSELNPQFAIRNAGDDVTRLPTASTCVNLLKLPAYTSRAQCLEKLLYAVHSEAGFDLS